MALTISDLTINIGKSCIIETAKLHCEPGEFIALCGPNGAGKSTLLKAIAGDIAFHAGHIAFDQQEIRQLSNAQLACIRAVMPQQVNMSFAFSSEEIISMGLLFCPSLEKKKQVIKNVSQIFHIEDLLKKDYTQLSGGQQQRVQLARVVAQILQHGNENNRYLLLDECSSAMDMAMMHQAFSALKKLSHEGIGIIAVVHDLNLASLYADKMIFISEKKTLLCGSPQQLVTASNIRQVFKTEVHIVPHPSNAKPMILQQAV
jgi:iron complex transport system ATP-binding protein